MAVKKYLTALKLALLLALVSFEDILLEMEWRLIGAITRLSDCRRRDSRRPSFAFFCGVGGLVSREGE